MTQKQPHIPIKIDRDLVQSLIAEQFPEWANLSVQPVKRQGNDNRTFHLGKSMSVRLPSASQYVEHVTTEQRWLPKLAPKLPLPIPLPIGIGAPGAGYPWPWSVNTWLHGENAAIERIHDLSQFAVDLAIFLNALGSIDTSQAPIPGEHNFFRGGNLSIYDDETRRCIHNLNSLVDSKTATAVWAEALEAKWQGTPTWFHGDVAIGNLLVDQGKLCGVIDFGQLAAGDPACDLMITWTLFNGDSRMVFQMERAIDQADWARGRGWALWKALITLVACKEIDPDRAANARHVIDELLSEHTHLHSVIS
jgi:aminoglycoside phosphotransferase (APT) family kinase protein